MGNFFFGDPLPTIFDTDKNLMPIIMIGELQITAVIDKLDRIVDEVIDHLMDQIHIRQHHDTVRFQTTEDGAIPAGGTQADVPARAVESGTAGNVGAGTVVLMAAAPAGIQRCTNPAAFTGGMDAEDDASLRQRILDSYRRLPNGANAAYYEQAAMAYPGVAAAQAVGRARGIGTVDVYIASAAGEPEESLRQAVEADLQSRREIAVDLQVKAPTTVSVAVTAELEAADYAAASAAVQTALQGYFTGERLGKAVLLSELHALLHQVEGLENYHILAPAADVAAAVGTLPVLGQVQLSAMT